jgi:hypothetical protein
MTTVVLFVPLVLNSRWIALLCLAQLIVFSQIGLMMVSVHIPVVAENST